MGNLSTKNNASNHIRKSHWITQNKLRNKNIQQNKNLDDYGGYKKQDLNFDINEYGHINEESKSVSRIRTNNINELGYDKNSIDTYLDFVSKVDMLIVLFSEINSIKKRDKRKIIKLLKLVREDEKYKYLINSFEELSLSIKNDDNKKKKKLIKKLESAIIIK